MSKHSPEPWTVTSTKYGWFAVHAADGMPVGLLQVSNKDIERILECVNACRSLPPHECCEKCRFYSDETKICVRFPKHETAWRVKYCGEFKEIIRP